MAVDEVHTGGKPPLTKPPERLTGTGPGVDFGKEMYRLTDGVPQGLIACAHGGTSMQQWDPALKHLGGKSLYGAMLRRFNKTCGKVRGVVWYQGCSETNRANAGFYTGRMVKFVKAMRKDFNDERLPVVIVQIACFFQNGQEIEKAIWWNSIQEQQRKLPEKIKNLLVVPAIDLPLDDPIHISGKGHHRLGKRLADAMYYFIAPSARRGLPPIELKDISVLKNDIGQMAIKIRYKNVYGKLVSGSEPSGFQLIDGEERQYIYRIDLAGDSVLCNLFGDKVADKSLYYGAGYAPYCNITDEKDRSLPVFGPITFGKVSSNLKNKTPTDIIKEARTIKATPFPSKVLVSTQQPSAGKLKNLSYPTNQESLNFKKRKFSGWFWNLHNDVLNCAPRDVLVYYKIFFKCSEDMDLLLSFAYDGPFKAWVNKKQIFFDPDGINPATEDKALVRFSAKKGVNNEVLMALGSNNGKAWGVGFRIIRYTPNLPLPSFHIYNES
jgi:sialate O-acetylesterase